MENFAQNLARIRRQQGLTQQDLAEKLNLTFQAISKWETAQSTPDIQQLARIAEIFHVSTDALLGHTPSHRRTGYEQKYDQERYYWGVAPARMCHQVMQLLPPVRPLRVLDIGCGEGKDAVFFARNGYEVSAFDLAESGLEKGRRLADACGVEVNFFQADVMTYRPTKTFDIIYSSGVLHYIPDNLRSGIIAAYQDVTAPGGLNALNVFVEKTFIPAAPDEEIEAHLWRSGELAMLYANWKFHRFDEEIFDCSSCGIPHQHCMDTVIAEKMA